MAADVSEVSNELKLDSESIEDAQRWIQSHLDNCENIRESKELLQLLQKAHAAKTWPVEGHEWNKGQRVLWSISLTIFLITIQIWWRFNFDLIQIPMY